MTSANRFLTYAIICASACLASVGVVAEQDSGNTYAALQEFYKELDLHDISVIVAVSGVRGEVAVHEFGEFKDDGIPAASTQVDLLSLTKSVTAISILRLVELKKLSLAHTLGNIFPIVPADKSAITIHQLLSHSSGFFESCGDDHDRLSKEELLKCAFSSQLLAVPGKEYHYSNVGYSILAAIIEEQSGKSYEEFLLNDVIASTSLRHTGYAMRYDDSRSMRTVDGRSIATASWGDNKPHWNLLGNGGLVSTAEEFIQFRQSLTAGQIVSKQLVELAHTPYVPEDDKGYSHYGYGVVVQPTTTSGVGPLLWHDGGSDDFSSEWNEFLDHGLTVFIAGHQSDVASSYSAMSMLRRRLSMIWR